MTDAALVGARAVDPPATETVVEMVAAATVGIPGWRAPTDVADPAYRALRTSVRASGVLKPLLLRRLGDRLEVVSGARRLQAALDTGQDLVPAVVRELSDEQALAGAADAIARDGLTPTAVAASAGPVVGRPAAEAGAEMAANGQAQPLPPAAGPPAPAPRSPGEPLELGWDEILRHNRAGDFWVVFHGHVYDVSEWMHRHPGGAEIYLEQYGQDATATFDDIGHTPEIWALAQTFQVGRLAPGATPPTHVEPPPITMAEVAAHAARVRGPGEVQAGPKLRPAALADRDIEDPRDLPRLTWEEIVTHDRPGDYWIVIGRGVYDVSEWLFHHPGGAEVFIQGHGHDLTRAFGAAGHSDEAWKLALTFKVGEVAPGSRPPARAGRPRIVTESQEPAPALCPMGNSAPGTCPVPHGAPAVGALAARRVPVLEPIEHPDTPVVGYSGPREIPYAVRWLVPRGERFANFDILNDNDSQLDYYRRFGHVYAVGVPTKRWRLVVVSDPELLDEVANNTEQFGKRVEEINFFDQLAGSRGGGISVVGDSPYYDRVRRVMLPWYAPAHQKTQFERMKDLARKTVTTWGEMDDAEPLDMRRWMERYAAEVSGRGACNYVFDLLEKDSVATPFGAAVTDSTRESVARITEARPDFTLFSGRAKRARRRRYRQQNQLLFSTVDAIVRGRLNTCPAGDQTDLLSRLATVADPQTGEILDSATIRDQLLMHLSNGFNGPSVTGAWLAHVLATHPEVEERLIAEIDGVTGGDPDHELQYTDLMALPYMTQVIKETLRIYPPMPVTIRRSLRDGMLGPWRIRDRDIILVGSLAAQRDPRYWGPTPEVFDPDQFLMEKVVQRPRHAFIPFSVGQRQCMAQEVTFMMLRIALFEIYNRFRLRLPAGHRVVKNTAGTTKPATMPVLRVRREGKEARQAAIAARRSRRAAAAEAGPAQARDWDRPSEIPETSGFRHIVVAYGSNFGSSRELAERFARRGRIYGFSSDVIPLDDLVEMQPRTQPWLLTVMTATYTGSPPSTAIAFKAWLDRTEPGCESWKLCRYLVWGLGNSQWNAFLAFPRYVNRRLAELGATALTELGYGDVGSPIWEEGHTRWNDTAWPQLIELAGALPSEAAAARQAAEQAAEQALTRTDSTTAMEISLDGRVVAPTLMTNGVGVDTTEVRVLVCRELQAPESAFRTRHLEVVFPTDLPYTAGDHLGVCPQNDEQTVARLARHLGAAVDGVFAVPRSMKVRAVPSGVPLQVRNVLTCLVDITSMPSVPLLDLLIDRTAAPAERALLEEIREVLLTPDGPESMRRTAVHAGAYDVTRLLDELPSCSINIFEFLQVAQPLRPRYYSTSSSPRIHGLQTAHVSVGRSVTPVPGMPGREFRGMSSQYVHTLREGDRMNVFLDRAEGFHLQEDVTRPMIFVSAGTGYAPMRAFLWERLAMKREGVAMAPAALFNGIRASRLDYIYREEIEMFVEEGVLDHLQVAMSRQVPGQRDYVQDRITAQAPLVWEMIDAGGYVYVCGSQRMRDDVRQAFVTVIAQAGGMSAEEAEEYLARMETAEDRYRPDVWG